MPLSNPVCSIKITATKVEYSDLNCTLLTLRKKDEKYQLELKCRFIDEQQLWKSTQEWGLLNRNKQFTFMVQDNGKEFELLQRCGD